MKKLKLTPWFSGDTKPLKDRVGVYKRDYGPFGVAFCWWDGLVFGPSSETRKEALDNICQKIARVVNGDQFYEDNWVDIQGYAKLALDYIREHK